jgi:hypothetical protein
MGNASGVFVRFFQESIKSGHLRTSGRGFSLGGSIGYRDCAMLMKEVTQLRVTHRNAKRQSDTATLLWEDIYRTTS